jgi:hypothetical protein
MFARHFCYFAALMLVSPLPAGAIPQPDTSNELNVRTRLSRAQAIMENLDQTPMGDLIASVPTRMAWANWVNRGYVAPWRIPWQNGFANVAAPWGNGWSNAAARVNPFNNWTNWHNAAWSNGGAAVNAWHNATPTGQAGEVCSQGLGCSTPQAAPAPTYSEGQTYFPHGSTFETNE